MMAGMSGNFGDLLKGKRPAGDVFDSTISKEDARTPIMERNARESPLLRLPAEIRNTIFRMAIGDQHVHISVHPLPQRPDSNSKPPASSSISTSYTDDGIYCSVHEKGRYSNSQRTQPASLNTTFPLEWRNHYDSTPLVANQETDFLCEMAPEQRVVYDSGSHMTVLSATCHQIHKEVGLLPYAANEFSFCSPYALNKWLDVRREPQARAVKALWIDVEWSAFPPLDTRMDLLALPQATLKVSELTWTTVSKAFRAKNEDLDAWTVADLDRGMDIFAEMDEWLHRSCGKLIESGQLKVEYVKEAQEETN